MVPGWGRRRAASGGRGGAAAAGVGPVEGLPERASGRPRGAAAQLSERGPGEEGGRRRGRRTAATRTARGTSSRQPPAAGPTRARSTKSPKCWAASGGCRGTGWLYTFTNQVSSQHQQDGPVRAVEAGGDGREERELDLRPLHLHRQLAQGVRVHRLAAQHGRPVARPPAGAPAGSTGRSSGSAAPRCSRKDTTIQMPTRNVDVRGAGGGEAEGDHRRGGGQRPVGGGVQARAPACPSG